jgi:uncharacterized protein YidB (DUF937 family)
MSFVLGKSGRPALTGSAADMIVRIPLADGTVNPRLIPSVAEHVTRKDQQHGQRQEQGKDSRQAAKAQRRSGTTIVHDSAGARVFGDFRQRIADRGQRLERSSWISPDEVIGISG